MTHSGDYLRKNWKRRKTWPEEEVKDMDSTGSRQMRLLRLVKQSSAPLNRPKKILKHFLVCLVGLAIFTIAPIVGQLLRSSGSNASPTLLAEPSSSTSINQWLLQQTQAEPAYKCAKYCSCSTVQRLESSDGDEAGDDESKPRRLVSLTQAKCESPQFSDVLTIDRRTQIIYISLPSEQQEQQQTTKSNGSSDSSKTATTTNPVQGTTTPKRKQLTLMTKLLNLNVSSTQIMAPGSVVAPVQTSSAGGSGSSSSSQFRMPRLMQFNQLREIVMVNLRIEVCDSEVFKRGQRLLKLKWNGNQLKQVSKNCFKHLDKLQLLNLDHNQLEELESALFSSLISLKHLSLAHNRLSELTAHQFTNLTQLISLNLVGNSFKTINLNLFEPMQNSLQLLILAKNHIRSFVLNQPPALLQSNTSQTQSSITQQQQQQQSILFSGVIFRNLIKLNVDFNRFERIKLLQLHRFFNVKFLSIRGNNIATIRDKAFNGLKLVELNLAQNKLQSISRCAFCNSTIKRLNLAENNISMPIIVAVGATGAVAGTGGSLVASAQQLVASSSSSNSEAGLMTQQQLQPSPQPLILNPPASSASMLVLGQSIFGPLFNHLEYLDLSQNKYLANQLEYLLEPLLELKYLNLASIGLERSLPTPSLFKNLRHLSYLNLSMNQLDQLMAETIEPLVELELLDLTHNDFSELEESFLVTLDELPLLKFVDFASNPWYCSQCKISTLYEWIQRSPIYNVTCLAQQQQQSSQSSSSSVVVKGQPDEGAPGASGLDQDRSATDSTLSMLDLSEMPLEESSNLGFIYKQRINDQRGGARGPTGTSGGVINGQDTNDHHSSIDFELILDLFQDESSFADALNDVAAHAKSSLGGAPVPNYQFDGSASLQHEFRARKRQLSERLMKSLASQEDDNSISRTIASVQAVGQLLMGSSAAGSQPTAVEDNENSEGGSLEATAPSQTGEQILKKYFPNHDFCLKCEFPSELRSFNLHELIPTDFRYCAGSAPRFSATEPKIGLTLAIVIIGALLVVIIVVIVMYRKKSNTYYPGEDLTDQLDGAGGGGDGSGGQGLLQANRKNQPVLSVSSDIDHQYGDATDYSSPPMSQSYSGEESYSGNSNSQEVDNEDEEEFDDEEDEEEEEEDVDDEEQEDEDNEEENEDEEEEGDDDLDGDDLGDEMQDIDDDTNRGGGSGPPPPPPPSGGQHSAGSMGPASSGDQAQQQGGHGHNGQRIQKRSGSNEAHTGNRAHFESTDDQSPRQTSREHSAGGSRQMGGPSDGVSIVSSRAGNSLLMTNSPAPSHAQGPSSIGSQATEKSTTASSRRTGRRVGSNRSQSSQGVTPQEATTASGSHQRLDSVEQQAGPTKQGSHYDRDDSTPIFIGPYEPPPNRPQNIAAAASQTGSFDRRQPRNLATPGATNSSFERSSTPVHPVTTPAPASLSAVDLMNGQSPSSLANTTEGMTASSHSSSGPVGQSAPRHNKHQKSVAGAGAGQKLAPSRMASLAGSSNDGQRRSGGGASATRSPPGSKRSDQIVTDVGQHPSSGSSQPVHQQQRQQGKKEMSQPVGIEVPSSGDGAQNNQTATTRQLGIGSPHPKTILHHHHSQQQQPTNVQSLGRQRHQQQRQASEHSTASSVSFANMGPRHHYHHPHHPHSSHHNQREPVSVGKNDSGERGHQRRLTRPAQTIGGDISDYEVSSTHRTKAPPGDPRHISSVRLEPQQMSIGGSSGGSSGQLADLTRNKSTTSNSQSSNGHARAEPHDLPPNNQNRALPSNHRPDLEFASPATIGKQQNTMMSGELDPGLSFGSTDDSSKYRGSGQRASNETPGAIRGRPLVKQLPSERESPPSMPEPGRQFNRQPTAQDNQESDLHQHHHQHHHHQQLRLGPAMEEDSLVDFDGQLDELPSDLDESNLEIEAHTGDPRRGASRLGGTARAAAVASYQSQSGPALEFDDEEEEEEEPVSSGDDSMDKLRELSGPMRVSHSTHSALTQTGSRDFE